MSIRRVTAIYRAHNSWHIVNDNLGKNQCAPNYFWNKLNKILLIYMFKKSNGTDWLWWKGGDINVQLKHLYKRAAKICLPFWETLIKGFS